MAEKFVRNITHTNLRAKDKPNEPLYTNVQNDLLSDEHDAFIRNEDANQPDEHYVLLTGNVETDRVDSSDSDILSVEKHDKHGLTFHPKHVKIGSTDKDILDFTEDKPHEFKAHPKHTKITTKNDELKVSEDKPLEFEIDDTQVKTNKDNIETNRKKIADHETRIKKNSNDIATSKNDIDVSRTEIRKNRGNIATNKQAIADNKTAIEKNAGAIKDNKDQVEENYHQQQAMIESGSPLKLRMSNGFILGFTSYKPGEIENVTLYPLLDKDPKLVWSDDKMILFINFPNIKEDMEWLKSNPSASGLFVTYNAKNHIVKRAVILEDYQYTEPVKN